MGGGQLRGLHTGVQHGTPQFQEQHPTTVSAKALRRTNEITLVKGRFI